MRVIKENGQYSVILNPSVNIFLIDQLDENTQEEIQKPNNPIIEESPDPQIYKEAEPLPYVRDPSLRVKTLANLHISRKKAELENAKTLLSSEKLATLPEINYGVPGFFRR